MNKYLSGILFIIIIAIVAVAYILVPQNSDSNYWFTVLWITILFTLNWFASAAFFSKKDIQITSDTSMGVLPGLNVLVFFYSILSLIFLGIYKFNFISWNFNLILQIIIAAGSAILGLTMGVAMKGAENKNNLVKAHLINECERIKRVSSSETVKKEASEIINFISHKLPPANKLNKNEVDVILTLLDSVVIEDDVSIQELFFKIKKL